MSSYFQHFTLSEVTLKVNGVEVYGTSLKLNFGKSKNLSMAYVRLFNMYDYFILIFFGYNVTITSQIKHTPVFITII
jgi:hypothetical protein